MSRLQKLSLSLFVLFLVGSSSATSALAYAAWPPSEPCVPNCLGKPVTINYTIGNIIDGTMKMPDENPVPIPLIRGSIEEGLHVWTTAININFVEVPDGPLTQLRFRHIYGEPEPAPPAGPQPKAWATCIGYGSECEVQFEQADRWQEAGTQANPDFLGATIHEVGHILGLDHSLVIGANMYRVFHRFSGLGTGALFGDDLSRIHAIYGAGVGSVTPMGVPEPAAGLLVIAAVLCFLPMRRRQARRTT